MKLPPYPKYKPSGVEWLGDVPEHWEVGKFSREIRIAEGQVDPEIEPYASMLLVAPNHIESGTGRLLAKETAADQGAISGKYLCCIGDVIYSKIRPALAKAVLAPEDCLCSADMYPMKSTGCLESRYVVRLFISAQFTAWSVLEADRVAMPKLNRETLNDLRLPIPPPSEQEKIADFLDRETAKIDVLVAKKRTLIERLKEKRTALISRTVTRGLPPAAARAAGLDPHPKLKPSGIDWLGDVPEHWESRRLRQISNEITVGVVVNPSTYVAEEGIPFLLGGDVREFFIDTSKCKHCLQDTSDGPLRKSRLSAGDLVVVRVGYPGVAAVVPQSLDGANCASMMIVRGHARFCSDWLAYLFNSQVGRDQIEIVQYGAAQKQFNISHAVDFEFPFPPRKEQAAMAEFLDGETVRSHAMLAKVEAAIQRLHEYRTALITAAVTGKIDVRESRDRPN